MNKEGFSFKVLFFFLFGLLFLLGLFGYGLYNYNLNSNFATNEQKFQENENFSVGSLGDGSDTTKSNSVGEDPENKGVGYDGDTNSEISNSEDNSGEQQPVGSEIDASFTASKTVCPAPCGVFFDATGTQTNLIEDAFTGLDYTWDFDDLGSKFASRQGLDANGASGALSGHVFSKKGKYNVILSVSDFMGNQGYNELEINVEDPEIFFENSTYCVSNIGNFQDCPTQNNDFHLNTYDQAIDVLFASNGPRRVLFHSGEIFNTSGKTKGGFTGPFHINSYGFGAKPIVYADTDSHILQFNGGTRDLTIANIEFMSSYDSSTGLGRHPDGFRFFGSEDIVLYKNYFHGLGLNIYSGIKNAGYVHGGVYSDNVVTGWQDYALFGDVERVAIIGNSIKQSKNVLNGDDGKCGLDCPGGINTPDHGPFRSGTAVKTVITKNDFFNNAGWSSGGKAHQPILRFGAAGLAEMSIISDNIMEGGFTMGGSGTSNPDEVAKIGNTIWERNKFIATNNTRSFLDFQLGGLTIRNNLFVKPANGVGELGEFNKFLSFLPFGAGGSSSKNLEVTNEIYGNTFVSLENGSDEIIFLEISNNSLDNFDVKNNIIYAPASNSVKATFLQWEADSDLKNYKSNNNIYFSGDVFAKVLDTNYNFEDWKIFSGEDAHTLLVDPLFIDSEAQDFRLSSSSLGIDNGQKFESDFEDITGKDRPKDGDLDGIASWDRGAYEFGNNAGEISLLETSSVNLSPKFVKKESVFVLTFLLFAIILFLVIVDTLINNPELRKN